MDFETRSCVDLKKVGASVYARHPSTEVLCLAWGKTLEDVQLWRPCDPAPEALLDAVRWGIEEFEAHNVFFERNVWRWICHERFGWPDICFDRWRCSMAAACYRTLPRSLEGAGQALEVEIKKDKAGKAIMQRLCKPIASRRTAENAMLFQKLAGAQFDDDPRKLEELYRYCEQDVRSEMTISQKLGELPRAELNVWQIDQRVNLRGVCVDRKALEDSLAVVESSYKQCCEEITSLTSGEITSPKQVAAIRTWIGHRTGDVPSDLSAETVSAWLDREDLPKPARRILQIRQQSALASTAKIKAMLQRADEDCRVRGTLIYHGATTGRWAGSGIQIQNYPRGRLSQNEVDLVHRLLPRRSGRALDLLLAPPLECISSSLRSMITSGEGKRLLVCDFASIEARVLAWIAGQEDLLGIFRRGGDVYVEMASRIYDVSPDQVTKAQRFVGKTAILGLGYGMGWRAFINTCQRMAGVKIDAKLSKRVVSVYRETNDRIKSLWGEVGTAAIRAIETGRRHDVGRLRIDSDDDWLTIQLPSKRKLHYRRPHLVEVTAPWSLGYRGDIEGADRLGEWLQSIGVDVGEFEDGTWVGCDVPFDVAKILKSAGIRCQLEKKEPQQIKQIQFWGVDSVSKKWTTQRTYAAKLVENIVQAVARDFLVEAMYRCEKAGYEIVGTVHDEIIAERDTGQGSLEEFESLMKRVPVWGLGCPIEVEGYEAKRYRK